MAENKNLEREYTIPLSTKWNNIPRYKRSFKSVKTIKEFIAKHMKVQDRDINKVKLDVYLNNEVWFRGSKNPPRKIRVKAIKQGDIVKVELLDVPEIVKFNKIKIERRNKKAEKKAETPVVEKKEKTEEEKKDEVEKEKSEEKMHEKFAEKQLKEQKHSVGKTKDQIIHRKALKK